MDLKILESELLKLSPRERALLTYKLLSSLENEEANDVEEIWLDEAFNRYNSIIRNKNFHIDSELVIKEAKSKYK